MGPALRQRTARLTMTKVILASGSPRRRELLAALGIDFEARPSCVEERRGAGETAAEYVERLAGEKAGAVAGQVSSGYVLGADTTVVADGVLLEKPADEADARRMLTSLSGRWHEVLTGLCLVRAEDGATVSGVETTRVLFHPLSSAEIDWYVGTGEPLDKAGAYGIQDYGALLVDRIEGNYFNVVGLPLNLLYRLARQLGSEIRDWR